MGEMSIITKKLSKKEIRKHRCDNCGKKAEHYFTGRPNLLNFACSQACIFIIIQREVDKFKEKLGEKKDGE